MIVKVGMMSVKGSASSKKAMMVPLVPPKSRPNRQADMGAHAVSIHSPMPGIRYESIPIISISMHSHRGGSVLLLCTCDLLCIGSCVCMVVSQFIYKGNFYRFIHVRPLLVE